MDELMEMELDGPELEGKGKKVFAAGHACVCNPLKKPHYPKDWYVRFPLLTARQEPDCETGCQRTAPSLANTLPPKSPKPLGPILQSVPLDS